MSNDVPTLHPFELNLSRLVDVPCHSLFRGWTEPKLITKWFTPAPWKTIEADVDLRAGGRFFTVMQSPEGETFPGEGVFLEVVQDRKLVFTDALVPGWRPSEKAFFVSVITFEPEADRTRYTARAWHWSEADSKQHSEQGFHVGWNKALDQLLDCVRDLPSSTVGL